MSPEAKDRIKRIGLFLVSGVLAGAVFYLSIKADDAKGADKTRYTIIGTVVAFGVVAVAAYENHRAESARRKTRDQAVKAAKDLALAYNQVLVPATQRLRDLAADYAVVNPVAPGAVSSPQDQLRAQILLSVLESAVVLTAEPTPTNYPRARGAYFEWDGGSGGEFKLKAAFGRTPQPDNDIPTTVNQGGAKMAVVLQSGTPFWAENASFGSDVQLGGTYRGVIVVPVRVTGRPFGVLTVDAPEYEDFIPAHVDLMTTLGNILAASLALAGP